MSTRNWCTYIVLVELLDGPRGHTLYFIVPEQRCRFSNCHLGFHKFILCRWCVSCHKPHIILKRDVRTWEEIGSEWSTSGTKVCDIVRRRGGLIYVSNQPNGTLSEPYLSSHWVYVAECAGGNVLRYHIANNRSATPHIKSLHDCIVIQEYLCISELGTPKQAVMSGNCKVGR